MARGYTLKKRAEQQAETRQRIVEAAVALHSTVGPAATTISMVAERAGVQRHTLYAHFPDERSMLLACSGHSLEQDPLPDAAAWRSLKDKRQQLRVGLGAVYAWYARNEALLACVLRDAETYEPVQEIMRLRFAPAIEAWRKVLAQGLSAKSRPLAMLALSFHTWRTLRREAGLKDGEALEAMARMIEGA